MNAEVRAAMAAEMAKLPRVDANGRPLKADESSGVVEIRDDMIGPAEGDHRSDGELLQDQGEYLDPPAEPDPPVMPPNPAQGASGRTPPDPLEGMSPQQRQRLESVDRIKRLAGIK